MEFKCLKCGTCCHEYDFAGDENLKRIPVFLDEIENLEKFAAKNNIKIQFIEDVVFPDEINKKILVITYKIILNGPNKSCPFYSVREGCRVNNIKPLACKAFPLAQKLIDAYHYRVDIDPYCSFIQKYKNNIKWNEESIKTTFPKEYEFSKELMEKNQSLILKIRELTASGKISIPKKINVDSLNARLKNWDREYIEYL
ncbi:MAG: YkgJ family cysteine cluster protein [Promethearchaeota archaeon]